MPVPTLVTDLSTTAASNSPSGSDNVFPDLDNYLRALSAFLASIRDNSGNGWTTPYLPLTYSAGTANGVLYLNGSKVVTTGSGLVFDGSNLGLGVTPTSGWEAGVAMQFSSEQSYGKYGYTRGAYYDGSTYRSISTLPAAQLQIAGGGFLFKQAAASTAGAAITLSTSMTLDSSGNLGIGVTPSASSAKTLEIGFVGSTVIGRAVNTTDYTQGAYYNGGWKYANSTYAAAVYEQQSGAHYWLTSTGVPSAGGPISFTQAMTLDASGNLGVGTTSPAARINAEGAGPVQAILRTTGASSYTSLRLYNDQNSSSRALELDYFGSTASGGERAEISTTGAYPLAFLTNNQERARITSVGDLLVGQTSSAAGRIQVGGFNDATYVSSTGIGVNGNSHFQGNLRIGGLAGAGSRAVNADANGTLSAASDESLKQEVTDAHLPGLAEVLQLQPKAYKWLLDIENRGDEAAVEIGFFANQVAPIIPSAAPKGNDGLYGFYDRSVTAALVKAIQEQQALITALTARVAALEAL